MIDAHVHFWKLGLGHYDWITPARPTLMRDYLPDDFRRVVSGTNVTGCIAVQAAPVALETEYLLSCAVENPFIKGVVGWTDLTDPSCDMQLDQWSAHHAFKGIRPMAGVQAGADWLSDNHEIGLNALAKRGLILEALALPHHVGAVAATAQSHSNLQILLNHAAKPGPDDLAQWRKDISKLQGAENVTCKLSGFTQQSMDPDHQARVCDVLLEVFGPNRLIWGSDHPVLLETSTYADWLDRTQTLLSDLSTHEQTQITSGTARRIYGLAA